ncbi:class IV lanthionine synthetase LanL [Actinacidiphila bryophytorum]|uniref:Protein kinase domain-containing protein n=1 Tax=Actinacidiphila bryophytorum TaxID=1436133 RepID=A0A9W4GYG5_9ACTN|nr:class IV lanthionine synthetase LanL [Actinacidiphila bryophytorum]MBM9438471.1 class IV lanthionine synthetase LanL [Actinacidiphila bryophytorum]MBN6542536.1 class IV lanthionine synthetase LanL [Actinacidiphila bryophytorum]CAG7613267.1 Protein kinase domain-containing protein [Actinacidiphila bryophytorum]
MARAVGEVQPAVAAVDSVVLLDVVRGVLARCGGHRWVVRAEDSWCMVTPPSWAASRPHGWKLHVSATPLSAPLVLARAAEVLARQGCAFKFGTDIARVLDLVNPWYDRGGAGKFVTVYPRDDVQFRALAAELDAVTADLAGPVILSDRPFRPGSLVHYRYGEFTADEVFTDDGTFESRMTGPDGSAVKDERRAWFSPPPWAVSPFPDQPLAGAQAQPAGGAAVAADPLPAGAPSTGQPQAVRLGGRFRVTGAIRHANKGGVYRATDERDGGEVVVKQARAHVGGLLDGTDARDRLRQEARILRLTAPLGVFPALVALIEEDSHLFLVQESVPGVPLDQWARDRADRGGPDVDDALDVARRLVSAVDSVHRAGLVLRDLKPSNVMVTPSGALRLIDAEYVVECDRERTPAHTPAFAAPEVVGSAGGRAVPVAVPEPSADLFSLGVTLFCAATGGLDPRWVGGHRGDGARADGRERARILSRIARDHPALAALLEPVTALTRADPARRWTPERTEKYLTSAGAAPTRAPARARAATWLRQGELDRLVTDGLSRLRASMTPDEPTLWPPARRSGRADACDLFRGAAGGLATLTRAARANDDPALWEAVGQAAEWIDRRLFDVPRLLPGLAFGRAGTAWALHGAARLLQDAGLAGRAVDLALELPTRHPSSDVTHGLSGAGTALLHLWHATHDPRLLQRALACADNVLDAARREGADWLWPTPDSADSALAGFNSYGFAHGVAGTGQFLLGAAQAVRHPPGAGRHPGAAAGAVEATEAGRADGARYMEAALGAADTLVRAARVHDGAAGWPTIVGGPFNPDAGRWCTGPAGIGTFLIRMWADTGEPRFADLAEQCAPTPYSRWDTTPGLCCGLAGTGHFLLDLAEHTGRTGYRTQAEDLAAVIHALRHRGDPLAAGRAGWDHAYGHGDAGTLGFLLRLRNGGTGPWTDAATGAL